MDLDHPAETAQNGQETKGAEPKGAATTASSLTMTARLGLVLTEAQRDEIEAACEYAGVPVAVKIRELALAWAREQARNRAA